MFLRRNEKGFSAIGLVIVIVVIALAIVLLLPLLGQPRGSGSRFMANSTQLRGIHQSFVTFAQSNKKGGNDGYFPGLDGSGEVIANGPETYHSGDGINPAARMVILLNGNFFTPEYMINPADTRVTEAELPAGQDEYENLSPDHFSYAVLGFESADDGRAIEWKETLNTSAIVMGDRGIGTGRDDLSSVWTETGSGDWRGGVVRNDNSTSFETVAEFEQTKYGHHDVNELDHLFEDAPDAVDAFLVHEDAATAYSVE